MDDEYWTFRVPGSGALVATSRDSEGFLFLNETAAWIWRHRAEANLGAAYAEEFGVTLERAEADVSQMLAVWLQAEAYRAVTIGLGGRTFRLVMQTQEIAEEILPRVAGLEIAPRGEVDHRLRVEPWADGTQVYVDGTLVASERLVTGARAVVLQELARLAVPGRKFGAVLHAGACGTAEGAVILAGASFSGKSTLCTFLMRAGMRCLSDDSACLTREFEVVGMPFALSLREGAWGLFPELAGRRFLEPNLGGKSGAVAVKALVFVNYQGGVGGMKVEEVGTFEALLEIQKAGFWVEHTEAGVGRFLEWVGRVPRYRLTYSDWEGVLGVIEGMIGAADQEGRKELLATDEHG